MKLLPHLLYKLCSSHLRPQPSHINLCCVCVCFGKWGVSARVLLTPQGVKDTQTNSASLSDSLFHVTLLEPFNVFFISGQEERKKMQRWMSFALMSQRSVNCVHELASCTCRIYGILCRGVGAIFMFFLIC